MKDLRPFGRLHIKLIRTYPRECEESSGNAIELNTYFFVSGFIGFIKGPLVCGNLTKKLK